MTFDKTLDAIMKLDITSREILFELLRKRLTEDRRKEIARNAAKAKKEFSKGAFKTKTALEIIKEISAK